MCYGRNNVVLGAAAEEGRDERQNYGKGVLRTLMTGPFLVIRSGGSRVQVTPAA